MIQEIKIKNFLSFRDEVVFSLEASNDKFAEDCQVVTMGDNAGTRLLRLGIVYGYNASGKTNLLNAFDFLGFFWTYDPNSADRGTNVRPFRLNASSPGEPTKFELVFFVDDTKYYYQLELDSKNVILEKLSYYRSTQPVMLFERVMRNGQSDVAFNNQNGDKVTAVVKDKITVECLKNMSFFVARDKANANLPLIDAAKMWLRNHMMALIHPRMDLTGYAQRMTSKDKSLVGYLLDFLRAADFNVTNITTDMITEKLSEEAVKYIIDHNAVSVDERERLIAEKSYKRPMTTFEHTVEDESGKNSYDFSLGEESFGTLKTFAARRGDSVTKGDIVADVESQAVRSSWKMAHAALEQAEDGYRRLMQVRETGSVTDVKVVEVKTQLDRARASAEAADSALAACRVKAPFSGVVSDVFAEGLGPGVLGILKLLQQQCLFGA